MGGFSRFLHGFAHNYQNLVSSVPQAKNKWPSTDFSIIIA